MEFVIVSGLSGAGRSKTAMLLEDMGFYCVDNMPTALIPQFAQLCVEAPDKYSRVALVTDVRGGGSFTNLLQSLDNLRDLGLSYKILFLEASVQTLTRRYKESRRRHPLAEKNDTLEQAIARECTLLEPLRKRADIVLDTSHMQTNMLRDTLREQFFVCQKSLSMIVMVSSFGFKYGLPPESDLVFDVRFLPNPYYLQSLKPLSGLDQAVYDYVTGLPQTQAFRTLLFPMLDNLLPQYQDEGKTSLVISFGCTGGRHRSVTLARMTADYLIEKEFNVFCHHRDVNR